MGHSAGLHLIMDAYVHDSKVFTRDNIERLFARLVSALDMKALDSSVFYEVPVDPQVLERVKQTGKFEDEGGVTGFQVISTSHMALHAWPLQQFFSLCAFSCKDFDASCARELIREHLGVRVDNTSVVQRSRPEGQAKFCYLDL